MVDEELNAFYDKAIPPNTHLPFILASPYDPTTPCSWFVRTTNRSYWVTCLAHIEKPSLEMVCFVTKMTKTSQDDAWEFPSSSSFPLYSSLATQSIRYNWIAPEEMVNKRLKDIRSVLTDLYFTSKTSDRRKQILAAVRTALWETFHWWFEKKKNLTLS